MNAFTTSGKVVVIGLMLWIACGDAFAASASLNAGVSYCNALADNIPHAAKAYALTGEIQAGFKPIHSRAWYADALGLKNALGALIAKNQSLIENAELLRVAATAKNSNSLEVFLSQGANPNATVKSHMTPTSAPLLLLAMGCQRTTNVLYLIAAGANIYATDIQGINAMLVASVGLSEKQPAGFETGVIILLAAGYDPRCPVAERGTTSILSLAKHRLEDHKNQVAAMTNVAPKTKLDSQKLRGIVKVLQGVTAIRKARSPTLPQCAHMSKARR